MEELGQMVQFTAPFESVGGLMKDGRSGDLQTGNEGNIGFKGMIIRW